MQDTSLAATLEAALVREVQRWFESQNELHFGRRLTHPVIMLIDSTARLGRWVPATRCLELSRTLVMERPWCEVTSVLDHEMAHQFVDEVLGIHGETAHGATFQRVCAERGIDARAAGAPTGETGELDRALDRIRKLLALAGSPNQHEAEMAMRKAHELMLRYNIETSATSEYEIRHLGDPEKRTSRVEVDIVAMLGEFFFVKVIRIPTYIARLGKSGAVYEIVGTRANVEMAAHVHAFLLATAERLWQTNRGDARIRNGRDRLAYQSGVIGGFRDKLRAERVELKGTGLVWVGDSRLDGFYHARHPRITHRRRSVRVGGAHDAGREAGRTVVLHKPVEHGSSGGGPRLLR